ncbi:porin [Vibrio sp. ZSDZ34]|uniref:Porin n=1 Tax=Vibrio gelatinilyticus TaxID=2893468 RepID=A0A9X1WBS4_9VIBR|nr:porin [Vibrio gelatinilyticus]MCJ2376238.1 porin [Vibrio gelatinilyticus]
MKKAILATSVLSALMSGSLVAAEVYNKDGTSLKIGGRAEFRGDFIGDDKGNEIDGSMKNKSRFRLNVGGETQISDNLTGFGFYEAEQSVDSSGDNTANKQFKQRYMYAGVGTSFGALSFGKQDTANVQVSKMTDIGTHTNTQKDFINGGDEQVNNTFAYSGKFMDALSVQASLIAAENKNENGYGLSGLYTLPFGLGLGLGYSANDNGDGEGKANQVIGGVSYTIGSFYVAGSYTQGDLNDSDSGLLNKESFTGTELAAHYKLGNGFRIIGAYAKSTVKNEVSGEKSDANDFVEITGRYDFNKALRTYVTYKMNNLKVTDKNGDHVDAENSLRLGLRYDF